MIGKSKLINHWT